MGILDGLDDAQRALVRQVLSRRAPDLLAQAEQGEPLGPGPRERLGDVLRDEISLEWVTSGGPTTRADAIESAVRTLDRVAPRQTHLLVAGQPWKQGDPIARGLDRYREVDPGAGSSPPPAAPAP